MFGNGPFMLEAPRTDTEIVLVPNPEWDGTVYEDLDLPEQPYLDRLTFQVSADPDTSYNSFEAGEGHTANIPPGRVTEATSNYANTLDVAILGSYHFDVNLRDPVLGGDENLLLRKAISQAIDRDEINTAVYEDSRTVSTGVTPEGIPGFAGRPLRLLRLRRRGRPGGVRRVEGRGQRAHGAASASSSTWAPATRTSWRSSSTTSARSASRPSRKASTPRRTSPSWPTVPAPSAGPAGSPTTRRTTTSCTTCSTPTRSVGTTTGSRTPSSTSWSTRPRQTVDPEEQADLFHQAETILLDEVGRHPDQLVPRRLRLQRGPDRQLHRRPTSV